MTLGLRHADARDQRRCKLVNHLPILRSDQTSVRLPFRLNQPITIRSRFVRLPVSFKKNGARAFRVLAPTLVALSFAGVAHAQGTMDFSGAQTLMGTFKTFAVYAGAVICFGGLIFAGIRMMSGRFQDAIPGLFGALFGAGVLGWGAGWIGAPGGPRSVGARYHPTDLRAVQLERSRRTNVARLAAKAHPANLLICSFDSPRIPGKAMLRVFSRSQSFKMRAVEGHNGIARSLRPLPCR